MRYISTRGQAPARDFAGVLLAGLAEDGGLFMPETWPAFSAADWRAMRGLSYPELATRVIAPFIAGSIAYETLTKICHDAYAAFDHLRSQEEARGFAEWRDKGDGRRFFRRGESGGWRRELTCEQVGRIEAAHRPMMQRLGYRMQDEESSVPQMTEGVFR